MLRSLLLYLSEREFPKNLLTRHALGRRLAARFIAGEELENALRAVRQLNAEGFGVTLDYLGESVHEAATAAEACRVYLEILDRLAAERVNSHVSVKLTQLGLAIDEAMTCQHLKAICERAARHHNFVRVDMEGSAYTDVTLRVFREVGAPRDVLELSSRPTSTAARRTLKTCFSAPAASGSARGPTRSHRRSPSLAKPTWTETTSS